VLLGAGAQVDARDKRFESTALAFATVGSGERAGKPGDWAGTVRLLIEAGASRDGVWITGKPPSEEVADLLTSHGITPGEPAGFRLNRDDGAGAAAGAGRVAGAAGSRRPAPARARPAGRDTARGR
jgi:hypothetical protein